MPVRGPDAAGTVPDAPLAGLAGLAAGLEGTVTAGLRLGGDVITALVNNQENI